MSEADGTYVLDTGSTDDTCALLSSSGVNVRSEIISPWRFDEARNRALAMVPDEACLCVSTDLDEVFEKGWRDKLENTVKRNPGANLFGVKYVWSHTADGKDGVTFTIKKTHMRHGFSWRGVVHETLGPDDGIVAQEAIASDVILRHFPDDGKSRAQYLPLLEQAVKEDPENDRNTHYLGREYMFRGQFDKAIATLRRHLSMKSAEWEEERAASMRYISRCFLSRGDSKSALLWLYRAVGQYPYSREAWIELAKLLYSLEDYEGVVWTVKKALEIQSPSPYYMNEPECFSSLPHDLLSIALYHTGDIAGAQAAAEKALELSPEDSRIAANVEFFKKALLFSAEK